VETEENGYFRNSGSAVPAKDDEAVDADNTGSAAPVQTDESVDAYDSGPPFERTNKFDVSVDADDADSFIQRNNQIGNNQIRQVYLDTDFDCPLGTSTPRRHLGNSAPRRAWHAQRVQPPRH
jgi:hypothetical protein